MLDNEVSMFARVRNSAVDVASESDDVISAAERSRLSLTRTVHSTRNLKVVCSLVSLVALDAAAAQFTIQLATLRERSLLATASYQPLTDVVSSQAIALSILVAQFMISSLMYFSI